MNWFLNLKTAQKILWEFALIGSLSFGVGELGLHSLEILHANLTQLYRSDLQAIELLEDTRLNQEFVVRSVLTAILAIDQGVRQKQIEDIRKFTAVAEQDLLQYEPLILMPAAKLELKTTRFLMEAWKSRNAKILSLLEQSNAQEVLRILNGRTKKT